MIDEKENTAESVDVSDVVAEMEQATSSFMESRGKAPRGRPKSTPKLETTVDEPEQTSHEDTPAEDDKEPQSQYSEDEQRAISMGWTPKDKYHGDPEKFIDAKEYIGRGDLYDRIKSQNDKIKKMEASLDMMTDLNKRQYAMIHKDRLDYYKTQKKAAIEINSPEDVDKYEKLIKDEEAEIERYSTGSPQQNSKQAQKEPPPEVKSFVERNKSWFNNSSEENERMVRYAEVFESQLAYKYPEMSVDQRLRKTEDEIKTVFSHKFENPNRGRASAVNMPASENLSAKKGGKRKYTLADVPRDQHNAIKNIARLGKLSVEEYVQQLFETGYYKYE